MKKRPGSTGPFQFRRHVPLRTTRLPGRSGATTGSRWIISRLPPGSAARWAPSLRRWIGLHRHARQGGASACGCATSLPDTPLSLIAGMGRVTSWSCVYLPGASGIQLAGSKAIVLFPAAMLPGGLGSTEATLVALLTLGGTLAAVGIRLATLWLATMMGMVAFGWLEARRGAVSGRGGVRSGQYRRQPSQGGCMIEARAARSLWRCAMGPGRRSGTWCSRGRRACRPARPGELRRSPPAGRGGPACLPHAPPAPRR